MTAQPASRVVPAPMPFQPMLDTPARAGAGRGGELTPALRARYGGDLEIPLRSDRPTIVANFVSTLDGVVSFGEARQSGGGEVSGWFEPDQFVMGLLRSLADVVLIGAGTLRADALGAWTPAHVHPTSGRAFAALRSRLGLRTEPETAIVSASGAIDLTHPGLADPAVGVRVITTRRGAARLRRQARSPHVEIRSAGTDRVAADQLLKVLADGGARLVLCEGGPHLLGQLLEARLVDELFLTIAPQVAGRSGDASRLSLVEGLAFGVDEAPWARLVGLRWAGQHLFTRYRFGD